MTSRLSLILVLGFLVTAGGCVAVKHTRLADGSPNPADRIQQLLAERGLIVHQSSLSDTLEALGGPRGSIANGPSVPRLAGVAWSASSAHHRLLLGWNESVRYYGITLNQHVGYLPMPIWGAGHSEWAQLTLSFDAHDRLTGWSREVVRGIDDDTYRQVDPASPTPLFGSERAPATTTRAP